MFEPKTQEAINLASEVLRAAIAFIQFPTDENQDEAIRLLHLYKKMSQSENR